MARFARVTMTMGPCVKLGASITINILGTDVTFISSEAHYISGTNCYFYQNQQPDVLQGHISQNVSSLENIIKAYLQMIGENRFEVVGTVRYDFNNFEAGGSVMLKAKVYHDELNIPFSVNVNGDGYWSANGTTNDNPHSVSFLKTDVYCYGSASGDIILEVTGGQAPYTYQWEDGPTTKDRPMVEDGVYRVVVTDSAVPLPTNSELPPDSPFQTFSEDHPGVVSLEITIGQPPRIEVQASVQGQDVTLVVTGGTPGVAPAPAYTYLWSDGSTDRDRVALDPGTYQLTITDSVGCTTSVNITVRDFRFFFSRNPITLELAALELESKPNLTFLCELWVEKDYMSGEFEKVTPQPLEHPADSDGTTLFDVRELLDAYVAPHLPPFGTASVVRADVLFRRFYLKYTQRYGLPQVQDPYTQVDTQYVVCGGLDTPETQADTFFLTYLQNRKPFFTWDLPEKQVYSDQPEFLYFMPNSFDLTAFIVKARVWFNDGTSMTYTVHSVENTRRFEFFCIPVGHGQLGLGLKKPGIAVKRWDIYVTDPMGAVISETRRYSVLEDYGQTRRYLVYTNSIGGLNTLVATGKAKRKLDPDSVTLEKSLRPGTPATQHELEVRTKSAKPTLDLSTGYRNPQEIAAAQDFLLSEKVWLVEADRFVPVHIPDKTQTVLDEAEDVGFLDFSIQFSRLYRYTPTLRLGGYLVDQTSDLKPLLP